MGGETSIKTMPLWGYHGRLRPPRPRLVMKNQSDLPIQTLRLSDRDKTKLLWAIEHANQQDDAQSQRRLRVNCKNNDAILTLKQEGGAETKLSMLARNLSRWGAALVHGRYIHPDARCELNIQNSSGQWCRMLGRVRHIRHIQGTIHELGVAFEEPIDLNEFVSLTPSEETRYLRELADDLPETDEAEVVKLAKRVLVVDDFGSDRKLLGHWLTQAGLTVTTASDAREALQLVKEEVFDLLVLDDQIGATHSKDLIQALRQTHFTGPIIAKSTDESDDMESVLIQAGADRFMKKPFTAEQFAEVAFDLIGLGSPDDTEPIFSTHKDDAEMRPLLTEFTHGLSKTIDELRHANAQSDHETLRVISHQLKGVSNGYGFPTVNEKVVDLLGFLSEDTSEIESIRKTTSALIAMLNRVKHG